VTANRDAGVDPRFDPQFQRGYDPAQHRTRRPTAPAAPQVHPPEPPSRPVPSDGATQPDEPGRVDPEVAPDAEYEPPRRNPFRLILLLMSLAAIAGAGILLWKRIDQDPYGGYGGYGGETADVFAQQFVDSLMVPLLTGGILGLCLWLALGALRRRDDG
jgi:hypothetical protein